ncbi:hypothetical protein TIFTF001_021537 [Ficus carica]|uniref:DUF4220 domain-containing protein n=1 Tax=Ficus carica TaxID=3494 RepID=A0AA88AV04_FICCA|nr:hypothetical protein TIFTF001_021537 [Ficus carica]
MLSLSLQGILILFAPFRKRTSRPWLIFLIWSTYLLADFIALFTIGLISQKQGDNLMKINSKRSMTNVASTAHNRNRKGDGDLFTLWAPFCLLHLGGPDTITAFSLQDNSLWVRHLAGLIIQVVVAVYTFVQSLPENKLWLPISFVLVAGIVKYAERTRALYLANLDTFQANPGPNYVKLMQALVVHRQARVPSRILMVPGQRKKKSVVEENTTKRLNKLDDITVVQHAYYFFLNFMNLIVDQLVLLISDRDESRQYFHDISSEDAFKVLSVELNFFYEVLYTKAVVVHCKAGYFFRFMSSVLIVVALSLFYSMEKHGFRSINVKITYILFGGAIALDLMGFFMFVFSDWTVVVLGKKLKNKDSLLASALIKCLKLKCPNSLKPESTNGKAVSRTCGSSSTLSSCLFRRWSGSVSLYNFMDYFRKELPKEKVPKIICYWRTFYMEVIRVMGLNEFKDGKYATRQRMGQDLWNFIFEELQEKSRLTDNPRASEIMSLKRGDWILGHIDFIRSDVIDYYINEIDYDQSLLVWHIATELIYNKKVPKANSHREISKTLSDYMMYLLKMQPTLMSAVAGVAKKTFQDTCAEGLRFFGRSTARGLMSMKKDEAYTRILDAETEYSKLAAVMGNTGSKSVLFHACGLAKELLRDEKMNWTNLSQVWVGLLSYAACRCSSTPHLELLGKGGQLITYVWLLMAHFGIGKQLYVTDTNARAKLIVGL